MGVFFKKGGKKLYLKDDCDIASVFPESTKKQKNHLTILKCLLIILILAGILLGGLFTLGYKQKAKKTSVVSISKISISPLPTSSASAMLMSNVNNLASNSANLSSVDSITHLDRGDLEIAVLNGSGEKGAAKEASLYLEGLGYKILRTGNADVFTYRNLTVIVRENKAIFAQLLERDLKANPELASVSARISDDIINDAEVIVGR